MRNAYLKDLTREILKSKGRFLSIFAIVALGVAFFAGVKVTCPDMQLTADTYFKDNRFMDFHLLSTVGFNDEDLAAVRSTADYSGIAPGYSSDFLITLNSQEYAVKVLSLDTEKLAEQDNNADVLNLPRVISGRLPQASGECVVEQSRIHFSSIKIGDTITLQPGTEKPVSDTLKASSFTVVGIVESPAYISFERGSTTIGSGKLTGYMMIPAKDFDLSVYTDLYLRLNATEKVSTYEEAYNLAVEPVKALLEETGEARSRIRYEEILKEANDTLNEGVSEYEEEKAKAYKELDDAWDKIQSGKTELEDGEKKLQEAKKSFNSQIASAKGQLTQSEKKLDEGEAAYLAGVTELKATRESLLAAYGVIPPEQAALLDRQEQLLNASKATLEASRLTLNKEKANLTAKEKEGQKELEASEKKLDESREELVQAQADYEKGKAEAEEKLSDAQKELDEAREEIASIKEPSWYVLDRDSNIGYVEYDQAAERMNAIARIFPVFFFLIATLVCLTTMTRMVDEQRTFIGALTALGYSKVTIAMKYITYAAAASIAGAVAGVFIGFSLFPSVIYQAYGLMFSMPPLLRYFDIPLALIASSLAVLTTMAATVLACNQELAITPALLLRPKSPKSGKRILMERFTLVWKHLSFIQKVTARNLFRYKNRLFMTIIGIAGCTGLMLAGFGIRDSVSSLVNKQFGELFRYNLKVVLKENASQASEQEVLDYLKAQEPLSGLLFTASSNVTLYNDESSDSLSKSCDLIVPEDASALSDFINLRSRTNNKPVSLSDDGVILTEKLAGMLKVKQGDRVRIVPEDETGEPIFATVTGITENYLYHYAYLSPSLYESLFGSAPVYRHLLVSYDEGIGQEAENSLSSTLIRFGGVASVNRNSDIINNFSDVITGLNSVVMVLIVSAAALAFIVLYNLTNINIGERYREIATIKVLGFYDAEVSSYVYRENMILTLLGALAGLGLGIFLHRFIMVTVEVDAYMFGRNINWPSFLYSAALTFAFSFFVNAVMFFRLKGIDMVESLKSVD